MQCFCPTGLHFLSQVFICIEGIAKNGSTDCSHLTLFAPEGNNTNTGMGDMPFFVVLQASNLTNARGLTLIC